MATLDRRESKVTNKTDWNILVYLLEGELGLLQLVLLGDLALELLPQRQDLIGQHARGHVLHICEEVNSNSMHSATGTS